MASWVARTDELARAMARLARGEAVVVTGEAGIGKSALVDRALTQGGLRHVTCRCFRSLGRAGGASLQLGFGVPIPVG